MSRIIEIKTGEGMLKAIEVDFEPQAEPWSVYKLLDGGTVRMKTTVTKLYKVVDDDGNLLRTSDGDPRFFARHTAALVASD